MKKYEETESNVSKFIHKYIVGFIGGLMIGLISLGLGCIIKVEKDDSKGTYHDYNKAVIITGNQATIVELDSYSHDTIGHEKYILYTKDEKVYECTPNNVVFYNE